MQVHRILLASLVGVLVVGPACTDDADEPAVSITGDCADDGLVEALAAWGGAGLHGAVAVDGPDGSCRLGVGRASSPGPPSPSAR